MKSIWGVVFLLATATAHSAGMTWQDSPAGRSAQQSNQPVQVAIVRAPESRPDWVVAIPTWALAIVTVALCAVTGFGVRKQGKDMERSVAAAEVSAAAAAKSATAAADAVEAAARHRRENLEREVSGAAHRVISTATKVIELANDVPITARTLFGLTGARPLDQKVAPHERTMALRKKAATDELTEATILLGTLKGNPPDSELTAGLRDMDRRLVLVELTKDGITRELENLNSQIELQRQVNEARMQAAGGRIPPPIPGR